MNSSLPSAPWLDRDFDAIVQLTLPQLVHRFGEIPAIRIGQEPPPGAATEADLVYCNLHQDRLYELVDGILIHKSTWNLDSCVGGNICGNLFSFVHAQRAGIVLPGNALFRLSERVVRMPSISYLDGQRAQQCLKNNPAISPVAPNLAVDVINSDNSQKEMDDKLQEYFRAGTEEVWYVYPATRELHQFTSATASQVHQGDVLISTRLVPGFEMKLVQIFRAPGE